MTRVLSSLTYSRPRSAERAGRPTPALVLVLFLGIGIWYSLVVPPFETPDEVYHYAFARHLAQGGGLPIQTVDAGGPWAHEGTQAPLYYFVLGRLTAGIDQTDFDQVSRVNPHANLGDPLALGNKNLMLYSGRGLALSGTNLAVHIGRWFSLTLALGTLWLAFCTARLAFPGSRRTPILTLLVIASIPQFAFISASVSNDNLVTCLSTAVVWWLARLVSREADRPVAWWEWPVLGALIGTAALSKLQALGLVPLAAVTITWLAWQRRSWRLLMGAAVGVALPALAVAGWWYWRNFTLYGEWLGARELLSINGQRGRPLTWRGFWGEMRGLRQSFWGLFGWFSILLPTWIYRTLDVLSLLAALGLLLALVDRLRQGAGHLLQSACQRVHLLLALWAALLVGLIVYWATFATSSQGRLLFPGISAFGILLVSGLSSLLARAVHMRQPVLLAWLPAGLLACSFYGLIVLLPDSYHAPAPLATLPEGAQPLDLRYPNGLEFVGIEVPGGEYRLGEAVSVTLYLRTARRLDQDIPLFVQLLDEKGAVVGNVTSQAGWGRNPTSLWQPDVIYPDRYLVTVERAVGDRSPLLAQVYAGFMEEDTLQPLAAQQTDGRPASQVLGFVRIVPRSRPAPQPAGLQTLDAAFADHIRLIGYNYPAGARASDGRLTVTLLWEADGSPAADYTAFVHLLAPDGKQAGGFDQPPAENRYPTRYWQKEDRSLSDFPIPLAPSLPPGTYEVWAGLYDTGDPALPRVAVTASNTRVQNQSVLLGRVELH